MRGSRLGYDVTSQQTRAVQNTAMRGSRLGYEVTSQQTQAVQNTAMRGSRLGYEATSQRTQAVQNTAMRGSRLGYEVTSQQTQAVQNTAMRGSRLGYEVTSQQTQAVQNTAVSLRAEASLTSFIDSFFNFLCYISHDHTPHPSEVRRRVFTFTLGRVGLLEEFHPPVRGGVLLLFSTSAQLATQGSSIFHPITGF